MGKKYSENIRFKGTFNFHKLYGLIKSTLEDLEYNVQETKFKQGSGDSGMDIEVKFESSKKYDVDFKFYVNVNLNLSMINPEATNPDNDGTTYGQIVLDLEGGSDWDYVGRFKTKWGERWGSMYKFLKGPSDSGVIKDTSKLAMEIKKFLNMTFDKE